MDLLRYSAVRFPKPNPHRPFDQPPRRRRFFTVRSSLRLPISEQKAKYYKELEAAMDVVKIACRLCVDVKKSLLSIDGQILEKNDQTPVTVADFGVQALVSLEMGRLFPSIPLVAEEDSASLLVNNLVDPVVDLVTNKATFGDKLTEDDVLRAIDRGGKDAYTFGPSPATYWVLDPIDGTRGFVKGDDALYVVGLALVVEGQTVLGVMGCPNWKESNSDNSSTDRYKDDEENPMRSGIIMISHLGCGTWRKRLQNTQSDELSNSWTRCSVDEYHLVQDARFCIPESQTWELIPLSALFNAKNQAESVGDRDILLLSLCCGSLCKYLMVASGRASVFIIHVKTGKLIKAWDHAVGVICVQEAGGKVSDWRGSDIDFGEDEVERRLIFPSHGILVSNQSLHKDILGMISSNSSSVVY